MTDPHGPHRRPVHPARPPRPARTTRSVPALLAALVAATVSLAALAVPGGAAAAAGPDRPRHPAQEPEPPDREGDPTTSPTITVNQQNLEVDPNGSFVAFLDIADAPAGAELAVDLYDRIDGVDGLQQALAGRPEGALRTYVMPLSATRRRTQTTAFEIQLLDPDRPQPATAPWAYEIAEAGVHPVLVRLRDPVVGDIARFVTFLVRRPDADDPAAAAAAVRTTILLDLDDRPADATGGTDGAGDTGDNAPDPDRDADADERLGELLAVLAEHDDLPLAVNLPPDRARRLTAGDDADGVLDLLARDDVDLLGAPYVPVDPQQLAAEGYGTDLTLQAHLGAEELNRTLGRSGDDTWLLRTPVDAVTAGLLRDAGVDHVVTDASVVDAPPTAGVVTLGPDPDAPTAVTTDLLAPPAEPGDDPDLAVTRLLAGAAVRTGLVGTPTATVLRLDPDTAAPALVDRLLTRIAESEGLVEAVDLDTLFDATPAPAGLRTPTARPSTGYTAARRATDRLRASYRDMLAPGTADDDGYRHELAESASTLLTPDERIARLEALSARMNEDLAGITAAETERVTLGTRDARIPFAITSTAQVPLVVQIHLDASDRLEFPHNHFTAVVQPDQRTIVQVPVRTRTSGDTPMTITVTSPDGELTLTRSRYTVRSTAVSGVGIFLTVGAAGFLVLWWGRHLLRARRGRRDQDVTPAT